MALAIIQPSPFDILPAPPVRARHLRNQRKLQRLAASPGQQALWEDEVARQLDIEGFAQLDDLLGAAASSQLREVVTSSLEAAAGAGGLSGGGAASVLRGDRTAWANRSSAALDGLLSRLDGLVSRGLGPRLPEASDLGLRSDAQFSVYPANGTRYGAQLPRCAHPGKRSPPRPSVVAQCATWTTRAAEAKAGCATAEGSRAPANTSTSDLPDLHIGSLASTSGGRCVYYLNPAWAPSDGGHLRISRLGARGDDGAPPGEVRPRLMISA